LRLAEAVITGNWGSDLSLLIKASKESGLTVTYYTLNAHNAGIPSSIGAAGEDHIKQILTWHANVADNKIEKFANDYKTRFKADFYYNTAKTELEMLARAMNEAKSTDPLKVARALEGMKYMSDTGAVWMRADDQQLMQPIYIATFSKLGKDVKYDVEKHRLRLEDRRAHGSARHGDAHQLQDGAAVTGRGEHLLVSVRERRARR
jgi:branched-chain amino acid transport system substrate-binding protein